MQIGNHIFKNSAVLSKIDRVHQILPSRLGFILGALAFTASLTPSLIPRTGVLQGIVAGLAFICFYGLGTGTVFLWKWLGLSVAKPAKSWLKNIPFLIALAIIIFGLSQATHWQNAIHHAMQIPPVESARPIIIAVVATAVTLLVLLLSHIFRRIVIFISKRSANFLPPRIAGFVGVLVGAAFFWSIGNGLLIRGVLHLLDNSYRKVNLHLPPDSAAPTSPEKTGSPSSLIEWSSLGAKGRNHVLAMPHQADIAKLAGTEAKEPLRVYVGLSSADTPKTHAALALAELKRIGGFDRSVLVIATPTGTGWIDPAAMSSVEILHRGDIASVSVQYSYLPSWLSLLVESDYGAETAHEVFTAIYGYWRSLPKENRPKLYLFGLSLGALNSDLSADFFDIVADPYNGALWAGPPYASRTWREVTDMRTKDSSAWLPVFRDSSLFRFQNQTTTAAAPNAAWGPIRIVYLQYASDPIVFFEKSSLWRRSQWMNAPRGPDVAPELRWMPIVTFLQLICDMFTAAGTPSGTGHAYDAEHYLNGWIAVTEPTGWSDDKLSALKQWLVEHAN